MRTQDTYTFRNGLASARPGDDNFDFSAWARLVRQQMLSSLQKRQREV